MSQKIIEAKAPVSSKNQLIRPPPLCKIEKKVRFNDTVECQEFIKTDLVASFFKPKQEGDSDSSSDSSCESYSDKDTNSTTSSDYPQEFPNDNYKHSTFRKCWTCLNHLNSWSTHTFLNSKINIQSAHPEVQIITSANQDIFQKNILIAYANTGCTRPKSEFSRLLGTFHDYNINELTVLEDRVLCCVFWRA